MARGGIYKSEVIRARDNLLAVGRYPSVDAIRQELGNTGSKTTIQRYLKEIDEEEGGKSGRKVAISESLQDLVARLAERLQIEADTQIQDLTAKHVNELTRHRQEQESVQTEAAKLRGTLEKVQAELAEEQARHQSTTEWLQREIAAHASANQQVSNLEDRLRSEKEHRQSLEDKHVHAREALEHFRLASKEQREQDQRQYEQQVQYLQGEIKRLRDSLVQAQQDTATSNLENARLVSELSRSERSLYDVRTELRLLKDVNAKLTSTELQMERFGREVVELRAEVGAQHARNIELEAGRVADKEEIQQLQLMLASARAAMEAQDQLAEKIQVWINQKPGSASKVLPTEGG